MRTLTRLEARVLGVLVEKALTVPDSYPLSLNTLTLGCNQKTARAPVMNASEADVQAAIDALRSLHLVIESSGSRVLRYEHNMGRTLALPSQSVALLAVLMLRGPQTTPELRANSERLHRFADASSVDAFLDELASRSTEKGGPLVVKLARAPGAREPRWAHLLCGDAELAALGGRDAGDAGAGGVAGEDTADWRAAHDALHREVTELRAAVERLYRELGVARD